MHINFFTNNPKSVIENVDVGSLLEQNMITPQ